jgi:hypothetical protein
MSYDKRSKSKVLHLAQTFRAPQRVTSKVAEEVFSALDCPRSLAAYMLFKYNEHDQLTALECHPQDYANSSEFRDAYTATKLLSKANFLQTSFDRKEVALKKFFEMEDLCKQTNRRFRHLSSDAVYNSAPTASLLTATAQVIESVLGDFEPEEFFDCANWGPGVTNQIKGEYASATNKFQSETGITRDLYAFVAPFLGQYPIWQAHLSTLSSWPTFEVGNVIITVPKDAKTDRVIAVEPGFNLWFQKAIGLMIRRRLRRRGINLNEQSVNQQLALESSKDGTLATVDFSSASDSISRKVVEELLPPQWYSLLDACRSHYGIHNSQALLVEKFSSMGNGFTFELESLIFYAAAVAVRGYLRTRGKISVYGDDVIIPVECYELFSSFCEFLGFKVNLRKSYSDGYFRESCGAHYYDGVDVKPIYCKQMAQHPLGVFRLANAIRRLAHRRNVIYGCDARLYKAWVALVSSVPRPLRLRIDDSLGDGGFVSNFDEACPSRARNGLEGYLVHHVTSLGVTRDSEGVGLLLARLNALSAQEYGNTYTLRGRTKLLYSKSLVARWTDLGPWI